MSVENPQDHQEKPADPGIISLEERRRQKALSEQAELLDRLTENLWGPKPETADEAADVLIKSFKEMTEAMQALREQWRDEVDWKSLSEDESMLYEDRERADLEAREESFSDCWREWMPPELKPEALRVLVGRGEKTLLSELTRFNDLQPFVQDVKTRTWLDENVKGWRRS